MTGIGETAKLIMALLAGALLIWVFSYIGRKEQEAAVGEQRGRVIESTTGMVEDGGRADEIRVVIDTADVEPRRAFEAAIEKANQNEPETAARSDRTVPASVRDAFRARRLARERSRRAGSERDPDAGAEDAAER